MRPLDSGEIAVKTNPVLAETQGGNHLLGGGEDRGCDRTHHAGAVDHGRVEADRAREVGSLASILEPHELRERLIETLERSVRAPRP